MDKFYKSFAATGASLWDLVRAGWIDVESFSSKYKEVLTSNIILPKEKDEVVVLLTTGSFAPAHEGHIKMLLLARQEMLKRGFMVDAIVISPSHDSYVLKKSADIGEWRIEDRLSGWQALLDAYPFENEMERNLFFVDLWESSVCSVPVNFTDVLMKIENDVERFWKKRVRLAYVFGDDNQYFADAFRFVDEKEKYFAVCVERIGVDFVETKNVFYARGNECASLSSTKVRKEKGGLTRERRDGFYCLREDGIFATKSWCAEYPDRVLEIESAYKEFHHDLMGLIKQFSGVDVISVPLLEQKAILDKIKEKQGNLINMDICTNGDDGFGFSRWFLLNDAQLSPRGIVQRGSADFPCSGDYVFVDDDIFTGKTLSFVKCVLSEHGINLVGEISLLHEWLAWKGFEDRVFDVLDTRDFLLESNGGGLMCNVLGELRRVPYWFPWVNLSARAKIPWDRREEFSKEVIRLNEVFFEKTKISHKNALLFLGLVI